MLSILLAVILAVVPIPGALPAVDISAHNGAPDNLLASEHPAAVFVRASYGPYVDSKYASHSAAVLKAGSALYAYLFLRPEAAGTSPEDQVDVMLRTASNARGFVIDWESDSYWVSRTAEAVDFPKVTVTTRASLSELKRAVDRVHAHGFRVGVYASELAPFPHVGQDWDWVANYTRRPQIHADVWQYAGVTIDRDWIFSSLTTLDAVPPAPVVTPSLTFVTANYYDCSSLPSVLVHRGAKLLDLTGKAYGTIQRDTHLCTAGLADGHTGQYVVLITTARYSRDGRAWRVWQRVSSATLE